MSTIPVICDRCRKVGYSGDGDFSHLGDLLEFTPVPRKKERVDGWTAERQRAFIAALERVAVLADPHNNVIKISAEPDQDRLVIRADAQDLGRGSESLAAVISGDPIEIAALKEVFRSVGRKGAVALGAVKTNIGHLDTAAGMAGLIKTKT